MENIKNIRGDEEGWGNFFWSFEMTKLYYHNK